jgi:hypothetical protein
MPSTTAPLTWPPEQAVLIEAPVTARVLVNAGPGTGKTAVACARVASLVRQQNIPASSIWLISFTRTAVKELRDRIYSYVGAVAHGINIATLDSQAFAFVQGFSTGKSARFKSYEENILSAAELLVTNNPDLLGYLDSIQHLFVDEAQDVVSDRAELVERLIAVLPDTCGVTVLCDEAQAIYGFSFDEEKRLEDARTLPQRLRASRRNGFQNFSLDLIHRTSSQSLLNIFRETRRLVLDSTIEPRQKLSHVRQDIVRNAGQNIGKLEQKAVDGQSDLLVLFRRRAEVLLSSSLLTSESISHRVRLSKTPPCLHYWLAVLLWDCTDKFLSRADFDRRWKTKLEGVGEPGIRADLWALLYRFAGSGDAAIDIYKLRSILARSRPPIDFTSPETGSKGPILGTIHSSKGREAPKVHLMLPPDSNGDGDLDEEARVLFVGATRAKNSLKVGDGYRMYASHLDTGRAISLRSGKSKALVEVGMEGDIDAYGFAGKKLFPNSGAVLAAQNIIWDLRRRPLTLFATLCAGKEWAYELRTESAKLVGHFTKKVNYDLFKVAKLIGNKEHSSHRTPDTFHVNVMDIRTAVVSADDPQLELLHEPFNRSGFILVPVVCGLPAMFFPYSRRRY